MLLARSLPVSDAAVGPCVADTVARNLNAIKVHESAIDTPSAMCGAIPLASRPSAAIHDGSADGYFSPRKFRKSLEKNRGRDDAPAMAKRAMPS